MVDTHGRLVTDLAPRPMNVRTLSKESARADADGNLILAPLVPEYDIKATYVDFGRGDLTAAGAVGPNTIGQTAVILASKGYNMVHHPYLSAFGCDYPSAIVNERNIAGTNYVALGVAAATATGVKCVPWIKTLVGSGGDNSGSPNAGITSLATFRANGWLLQVQNGTTLGTIAEVGTADTVNTKWVSPAIPAAREYIISAVVELATLNPSIDGILLDFCRYPSQVGLGCYSTPSKEWFESKSGRAIAVWPQDVSPGGSRYAEWLRFHTWIITSLVAEIAQRVRTVNPSIKIGCSPFPDKAGREARLQFVEQWAREGSIDWMFLQCYAASDVDPVGFARQLEEGRAAVAGTNCQFFPIIRSMLVANGGVRVSADVVYADRANVKAVSGCNGIAEFSWVTEQATSIPNVLT
jgi:uncharacterized lipoprotein YddW (UPF0748 family)